MFQRSTTRSRVMKKVGAGVALALLASTVPLAANAANTTSSASAGKPEIGGKITVGVFDTFPGFCMKQILANSALGGARSIAETLFERNSSGKVVGFLLKSATPSADFKTWNMEIRKKADGQPIQFHDGAAWNADALIANFNAIRGLVYVANISKDTEKNFLGSTAVAVGNVVSTTKVDDYNVSVKLNSPQADLRELMYASGRFIMRSPNSFTDSAKCASTLVGTGPFKQKSAKTTELVVVKNKNYWRKDAAGGNTATGSMLWDTTNDKWIAGPKGSELAILRVGGDSVVSGSSQITYASISSIPAGIVSGSSQIDITSTTGFSTYSTSVDSRITTEKGRVDAILSAAAADKDSFAEIVTLINSVDLTNDTAFASFYTASVGRLNNLETTSGSVNISVSNLNTFSSSALTRLAALEVETANLETFSSSALTRLSNLEGKDISITLTGDVTGTGTITDLANVSFATTIAADSVALGTDTTGNYVASLVAGTNITLSNNSGEGATPTIGLTNNSTTIGSTAISLGSSATTIAGLTSVTSTGFTGALTGNASTATTLATARNINGVSFNGSADITVTAAAGTLSGATLASGVTASSLTSVGTLTSLTVSGATATGALTVTGAVTATGDITAFFTSDKRHKNNIKTIPNALEKVTKLNGVTWEWNDDVNEVTKSTPKTGLIAQEVQEVLPEVVKTRDDGFLALDYSKMMGLMVEAIKEQQIQIEELKAQIGSK